MRADVGVQICRHSTTINDLVAGTSWTYRVRAHNAEGWGGHSLQSPVFAVLPTTPSAPGRPDALNISEYTLTLKWALPCDHGEQLVGHLLEMAVVPQDHDAVVLHSWVEVSRLLPDPTRYLQGLNPGTSYIFRAKVCMCMKCVQQCCHLFSTSFSVML